MHYFNFLYSYYMSENKNQLQTEKASDLDNKNNINYSEWKKGEKSGFFIMYDSKKIPIIETSEFSKFLKNVEFLYNNFYDAIPGVGIINNAKNGYKFYVELDDGSRESHFGFKASNRYEFCKKFNSDIALFTYEEIDCIEGPLFE